MSLSTEILIESQKFSGKNAESQGLDSAKI